MVALNRSIQSFLAGGAALACLAAAPAFAEERTLEWSVTATGTSDYMFRGLSLNNEDPAFQASFDLTYGIWYGSLWGSMVDGPGYEPVELNLITGITPKLGPVTFDFGLVYYFYPWADGASDSDYVEFKAAFDYSPITNLTLTPAYWYVPDQGTATGDDDFNTLEGTIAYELPAVGIFTPTVSGLYGWTEAAGEYNYWNAGLALSVEKFTFDFRYWDTDITDNGLADERFVFTAAITLP